MVQEVPELLKPTCQKGLLTVKILVELIRRKKEKNSE